MALASPARPFWIAFQSNASWAVSFLGSGILRPSRPSIRRMMMVLLFRPPFLRPFGFPDSPFFQECAFGGFLKPISVFSEAGSSERKRLATLVRPTSGETVGEGGFGCR